MKLKQEITGRRLQKLRTEFSGSTILGMAVRLTCPECGGPISELNDGIGAQFRCQVGHGFSPKAILVARLQTCERTLWHLVSTLMESARLLDLLAEQSRQNRLPLESRAFRRAARQCRKQARTFEKAIAILPEGHQSDPRP